MKAPGKSSLSTSQAKAQCLMAATMFLPTPNSAIAWSSVNVDLGMVKSDLAQSNAFFSHICLSGKVSCPEK